MTCADVNEQLVDYLYGELAARTRARSRPTSPGARAAVRRPRGWRTLGVARAAFRGPLAEEPPVRVRALVLAAAAEAVRPASRAAVAAPSPDVGGFWAWLRKPWFIPALGAASVIAVFVAVSPAI